MKLEEIADALESIKNHADCQDYEEAHRREDRLMLDFIQHVKENPKDPGLNVKATKVLELASIKYPRW